ncbi:MAG: hypothetical protein QOG58_3016, partial [Caballeronia sp.]|nr:hypothetical protein [Caballeronia sp.]
MRVSIGGVGNRAHNLSPDIVLETHLR